MEFLALRPAYAVKCNVHWDRVQKHLDEQFSASTLFASSEIDKVVDQLIENRDIELDVDTFVPEGEDTAGVIADRDRAVNEVREMITNAFFTSSLDPINSAKDGWDRAAAFGERISQLAVTGGLASIAHFSYNKLDYTRIDQKNLVVNMSERTVVNRSLYPQGHLSGLTKILQQSGVDLNQFIIHVKLDDPFFQRRKIAVYFPRSFDAEAISTIEVNLNYGADIKSVVLSPANPSGTVDWASQLVDNAMKREVSATYKVNFNSADSSQRPLFLNSGTEVVTSDVYSIETSQLYEVVRVPVHALPPFPWDHYANVDVQLQYNDAANGIALLGHFMLNQDHPEVVWEKFQRPPFSSKFQFKLIYYAADNQAIEQPWVDNDGDEVRIVDPFPSKRTVLIVPDFLWTVVDRVFVDVSYTDPGNAVAVQQHYEFNANSAATQHFTTDLRNPNVRRVEYETTIIMKDTRVVRVPRSATLDTEIIVNTDMRGHLIVQVKPDNVDFASVQLQQVTAQIRYQDPANNLAFKDSFRFSSSTDQGIFNYDYIDPQNSRYQSSLTYQYTNGFIKTVDWLPGDGDLLIPINPM
jgi:hypothetical protein